MELSKYIYNLFEMDIEEKIVERTFGVVPITIEKKTYFFVLLNTSWCCIDENDTRKIVLGKFQLDKISEEAIKLRRNIEPSLSICLGHHPLQCLEGNEETTALMELTDSSRIMANGDGTNEAIRRGAMVSSVCILILVSLVFGHYIKKHLEKADDEFQISKNLREALNYYANNLYKENPLTII